MCRRPATMPGRPRPWAGATACSPARARARWQPDSSGERELDSEPLWCPARDRARHARSRELVKERRRRRIGVQAGARGRRRVAMFAPALESIVDGARGSAHPRRRDHPYGRMLEEYDRACTARRQRCSKGRAELQVRSKRRRPGRDVTKAAPQLTCRRRRVRTVGASQMVRLRPRPSRSLGAPVCPVSTRRRRLTWPGFPAPARHGPSACCTRPVTASTRQGLAVECDARRSTGALDRLPSRSRGCGEPGRRHRGSGLRAAFREHFPPAASSARRSSGDGPRRARYDRVDDDESPTSRTSVRFRLDGR